MIFYFSGTGNSCHVARTLAIEFNELHVVELSGLNLIDPGNVRLSHSIYKDKRVIWVFPVYSWGVPPVVVDFIKSVTLCYAEKCQHYMVCTCGDDIGNAHKQWRQLIRRRGWVDIATYSVIMPNTYTLMKGFDVDSKEVENVKIFNSKKRIKEIATKIKRAIVCDDVTRGRWAWFKSTIIYPYFKRFCMSPRPFHSTDACVSCGLCAAACPLENITMKDGRPTWGDRCALCLRCYHQCPSNAVAYGKATIGKGQYYNMKGEKPSTNGEKQLTNGEKPRPVDLGLHVCWCTHNVGAATPADFGDMCEFKDAALIANNLGPGWKLPEADDFSDLINYCQWTRTDNGYKVTGPNGNSIFIPIREEDAGYWAWQSESYWLPPFERDDPVALLMKTKNQKTYLKGFSALYYLQGIKGMVRPIMGEDKRDHIQKSYEHLQYVREWMRQNGMLEKTE